MKSGLQLKKISLFIGDIAVLYLSLYLTLSVRYLKFPGEELWNEHAYAFAPVFIIWAIIFYISNLYDLRRAVNNLQFFQLTTRSILISGAMSIAYFYLLPQQDITPKRNLFIYLLVFYILFTAWRRFFNWLLKSYLPKNDIGIIGINDQVEELLKEFKQRPHLGYHVSFILDERENAAQLFEGIDVIHNINELPETIKRSKVSTVILTVDLHHSEKLRSILFDCLPLKINYISLPNFYESITGKIPIDSINQMWFLENLTEGNKKLFDIGKRTYDFLLALLALVISAPLWPLIGFLIKLSGPGPIFFRQIRLGKENRPFSIVKFRTMKIKGNDLSPTTSNDSRVTSVGAFLRATRIDELPQILNILKGDMSFVGPRPERPEFVRELEKEVPFYRERMLVKPGLTGSDQVSGEYHSPSRTDTLKKLQYDLYYIKNRSLYLDLSVILKTIATVLSKKGI